MEGMLIRCAMDLDFGGLSYGPRVENIRLYWNRAKSFATSVLAGDNNYGMIA